MKTNRIIYKKWANEINKPFISILIVPRQVGKTFLMHQRKEEYREDGMKAQFHNLDDPYDLRSYSGDEEQHIRHWN